MPSPAIRAIAVRSSSSFDGSPYGFPKCHRDIGDKIEIGVIGAPLDYVQCLKFSSGDWFWFRRRNVGEIEQGYPSVVTRLVEIARSAPFSLTTIPMISTSLADRCRELARRRAILREPLLVKRKTDASIF